MLTPEQKAHFETFGFLQIKQAFSPEEIGAITRAFDEVLAEDRGGKPFEGKGQSVWAVVEQRPALSRIVEDDRIFEAVGQVLGPGFLWAGSEGTVTSHAWHGWHADRPGESEAKYPRMKMMLYLDETTKERGALRVVPGSHKLPFHMDLWPLRVHQDDLSVAEFDLEAPDLPSVPVESQPGDVIFFFQSLFHAVFNSFPGRRYIALKFAAKPATDEHLASLVRYTPTMFEPDEAFRKSERARIRSMVDPLLELAPKAPKPEAQPGAAGMMR